jgi:hypothetical protein
MEDTKARVIAALTHRIIHLETEISAWRSKNSQSNPGAVMELRDMRKHLEKAKAALSMLTKPHASGTSS